jgi:hypothetical protein
MRVQFVLRVSLRWHTVRSLLQNEGRDRETALSVMCSEFSFSRRMRLGSQREGALRRLHAEHDRFCLLSVSKLLEYFTEGVLEEIYRSGLVSRGTNQPRRIIAC